MSSLQIRLELFAIYAYAGLLVALLSLWMAFAGVKKLFLCKCGRKSRPHALVEAVGYALRGG